MSAKHTSGDSAAIKIFDIRELAETIKKSPGYIHRCVSNPALRHRIPVWFKAPSSRRLLWRSDVVYEFLFRECNGDDSGKRRRGRPRKRRGTEK